MATGGWNALTVLAVADKGNLLHAPDMYMDKIAVGPECRGLVDLDATVADNLHAVAKAKDKEISEVTVTIINRPRNQAYIDAAREAGARVKLFENGDVAGAINTCFDWTGVDIMLGIGGAPEGVISAVGIKCLGGDFQGRLHPVNDDEVVRCESMGVDAGKKFLMDDVVKGDDSIFAATAVTDGEMMKGVQFKGSYAETSSVVMRAKSGTVRFINGRHSLKKKPNMVMDN